MTRAQSSSARSARRVADLACVGLFCGALMLPLLGFLFDWHPVTPPVRALHRAGTRAPALDPLAGFATRFERYFDRHLGFRQLMVRWNNAVTVLWLRTDPLTRIAERQAARGRRGRSASAGQVKVGRDGWLFYFGPFSEESYRGLDPVDPAHLEMWRRHFEVRRVAFARRGIHYLLVIVPEKYSVMPDLLPAILQNRAGPSRADEVIAELAATSEVEVLDLRSVIREQRGEQPLFHLTGTHWNELGAFLGYQELLRRLEEPFPALEPWPIERFEVEQRTGPGRGLTGLLGISGMLEDEYVDLTPRVPRVARRIGRSASEWRFGSKRMGTGDELAPRAVFLHDSSVATYMEPFLSEHFEDVTYFWQTYTKLPRILAAKPDLVVEVRVERLFDGMLPAPSGALVTRDEWAKANRGRRRGALP